MKSISARRPRIHMITDEAEALTDLAISAEHHMPEVSDLLLTEISRAHLHPAEKIGSDVVTMGATVTFTDEASGRSRTVRLVYPAEADIEAGRISILTPIGAALIGLSEGQSIVWPDRNGRERTLTIQQVRRG